MTPIPKGLQVGGDLFIRASVFAMDIDDMELREMIKPGLLAVFSPIVVGLFFKYIGYLVGH